MVAITIPVISTAHAFQDPRVIHADRGVAFAALVRALDTEHAFIGHTFTGTGAITIITADALDAGIPVEAFVTDGRRTTAADIALGITGITGTIDALTTVRWTLRVALATHTASATIDTEWGVPITAGVTPHLAEGTGIVHALLTATVVIVQAGHTGTAIG